MASGYVPGTPLELLHASEPGRTRAERPAAARHAPAPPRVHVSRSSDLQPDDPPAGQPGAAAVLAPQAQRDRGGVVRRPRPRPSNRTSTRSRGVADRRAGTALLGAAGPAPPVSCLVPATGSHRETSGQRDVPERVRSSGRRGRPADRRTRHCRTAVRRQEHEVVAVDDLALVRRARAPRASSRVERPSRPGISAASKLTSPRATA